MARGAASPAPLPKVSFVKVTDEVTQQPPGVHDHVARSYGYNGFNDDFMRPVEHYIRYIEPLESDLATQVEYDMDEQDQEWLDSVNIERKAQQLDKVSYETFEIIMDRLEKEWFDLSKNIPKSDMALPSEDSTCAICDDSEGENTNAIVFCDGCNLAVHQDCYGVPYIPEGQWLCRKCTVSPENPVSCILCPNEGGAFKQTVSGEWVHLLCAIWVPETTVANDVFMEPITGVEKISKQRWRLRCSVCDIREGACIQCTKASCFTAFHATCARKEKLLMPMKATQGSEAPTLACYCEKHLPREQQEARIVALRAQHTDDSDIENDQANSKSNKTARAYARTYKPGPPLVPRIIVNRILQYISRLPVRHKAEFVHLVCRYWSLKREARRGAPLLKRLHLEPWTALSGSKQQTDEEKLRKLDHMRRLRLDLERVRLIIDVIRHRESAKQKQQEQIQLVLSRFFFPHEPALRFAFEKIISHDRQGYFKSPVNKNEIPDYYDIIQNPRCWDTIDQKLDGHQYLDLAEFKRDVQLVVANAIAYNQAGTPFYKTALRIQNHMPQIFADLDQALSIHPGGVLKAEQEDNDHLLHQADLEQLRAEKTSEERTLSQTPLNHAPTPPQLGDLEPSLDILELLVSEEVVRQDTSIVMMSPPIESLLSYEMPILRPPAPPQPPPKPKPQPYERDKAGRRRPKIDRKAALERKRLERLRALDSAPGFRAPRTRAALAAAAVFEAEASGASLPPESSSAAETSNDASSSKTKKPKRSAILPPPDLPLVVDNVDNRKSFTMFERGWILPPDQKRGGRARVERQPLLPPKKKVKISHDRSCLSLDNSTAFSQTGEGVVSNYAAHQNTPPESANGNIARRHTSAASDIPDDLADTFSIVSEALLDLSRGIPAPPVIAHPPQLEANIFPINPVAADFLHPASTATSEPASLLVPTSLPIEEIPMEIESLAAVGDLSEEAPSNDPAEGAAPDDVMDNERLHSDAIDVQDSTMLLEPELIPDPDLESMQVQEVDPSLDQVQDPTSKQTLEQETEQSHETLPQDQEPEQVMRIKAEPTHDVDQTEVAVVEDETAAVEGEAAAEEEDEEDDIQPPRIIIIESLDTPATRREKNRRKKLERQAAREAAARQATVRSSAAPAPRQVQSLVGSSRLSSDALEDDDSDLTDLSDAEGHTSPDTELPSTVRPGVLQPHGEGPVVFRSSRRAPPPVAEVESGAITVRPGEKLEGGTLVWAKIESFPWWPAVVFEEDDSEVPESVAARAPPSEPDLELVRFYEKKHINNWAWVRHRNMRYLGEDDSLDAQMLAPASKYQRWRSAARRTECRNAYRDALAEMEADGKADDTQPTPSRAQARIPKAATSTRVDNRVNRSDPNSGAAEPLSQGGIPSSASAGDGLHPAAMDADSPMTDVDSSG
ncbi:hypothetical protein BC628DRAFT_1351253 [Trametes gibbosa]|nr:hypothetical protein BC628DRAFT_1351253 [Trametes gibbosa]